MVLNIDHIFLQISCIFVIEIYVLTLSNMPVTIMEIFFYTMLIMTRSAVIIIEIKLIQLFQ